MSSSRGCGRGAYRFDLLIDGGPIVDGTGAPGFAGAVAIVGDRLRDRPGPRRRGGDRGRTAIDAAGRVIAPGFIDLHSHSGLMILAEPRHEPKVRQGVTTEVIGVDGLSYAPIDTRDHLAELVEMNAGLDGHPDIKLDWRSVQSYLTRSTTG